MKFWLIFVCCFLASSGPGSASWTDFVDWVRGIFQPNQKSGGRLLGIVAAAANSSSNSSSDPWKGYFTHLYQHDNQFCLTLLVCQLSASPKSFKDYGPRVANFFPKYKPSVDNKAGWWYKNAALLGHHTRSMETECRKNIPCKMRADELIKLLKKSNFK